MPPCFLSAAACGGHVLGTDEVGRDLAARLVAGATSTLGLSLLAVVMAFALGLVGEIARFGDAASALAAWPFVLIMIVIELRGPMRFDIGSTMALLAALVFWPSAMQMLLRTRVAVRLLHHGTRMWATMMLVLATIDFFGYGVQPPVASWGNALASAQATLQNGWWVAVFPGLCLLGAAAALHLIARTAFVKSDVSSTSGATDASGLATSG